MSQDQMGSPDPVTGQDPVAATRASYDAVAGAYAEAMSDELRHKPLDRALLTAFARPQPGGTPAVCYQSYP